MGKMPAAKGSVTRGTALTSTTIPAEGLFRFAPHNSGVQQSQRNPKSAEIGKRLLRSNNNRQTSKMGHKKKGNAAVLERQGEACPEDGSRFEFLLLPFDLQEYILRFLPARSLGLCPLICKAWDRAFEGAVASIFSKVVGAARGRSRLVRSAEMRLVHSMRHTHDPQHALEMLLWAAFNGHNQYCLQLLDRTDAAVSVLVAGPEDWDCATALHVACRQGNVYLVEQLLRRGAVAAAVTKQRRTALIVAAEYNQLEVVRTLLLRCRASVNVNATDMSGRSALFIACEKGFHQVVYAILDTCEQLRKRAIDLSDATPLPEPDVNLGNPEWGSPLCVACKSGFQKIVGKLLASDACVNLTTDDGRSPLFIAAERSAINTTKVILTMRPPVTEAQLAELILQEDEQMGEDAAAAAAACASEVPGVELKTAGTIVDLVTSTGKTALFAASEKGLTKVIKVLLDAGASVSKPTFLNKTPLYAATENGHLPAVKLLLQQCTRKVVEHETNFGTTALFMAQRIGNLQIKNLLTDFCLSTLSKEKTLRDKTANAKPQKIKQKAAMNRLTELKEKSRGSAKSIAHLDDRVDLELRKSKATVQRALDEMKQLQALVENAEKGHKIDLIYDNQGGLVVDCDSDEGTAEASAAATADDGSTAVVSDVEHSPVPELGGLQQESEGAEEPNEEACEVGPADSAQDNNDDDDDDDGVQGHSSEQEMIAQEIHAAEEESTSSTHKDDESHQTQHGQEQRLLERESEQSQEQQDQGNTQTTLGRGEEEDEYGSDQDFDCDQNPEDGQNAIHDADGDARESLHDETAADDVPPLSLPSECETNASLTASPGAAQVVPQSDSQHQEHGNENENDSANNAGQPSSPTMTTTKPACKKKREIDEAREIDDAVANEVGWAEGIVTGLALTKVRQALTDLPSVTSGFRLNAQQVMKLLQVSSRSAQKVIHRFAIGQSANAAASRSLANGAQQQQQQQPHQQQVNAWEILVIAALFATATSLERRAAFVFNLFDPARTGELTDRALHNLFACCQNGLRKLCGSQPETQPATPRDCDFWVKSVLDNAHRIRRRQGKDKGKGKATGTGQRESDGEVAVSRKEFVRWAARTNSEGDRHDDGEVSTLFDEIEDLRRVQGVR